MSNPPLSTFDREMQDPVFRQEFDQSYHEFLLDEMILAMMDNDSKSVRALAKAVGLSPTIIQNLRSGKQADVKLSNFINISHACGYHITLQKGKHRIAL